LATAHKHIATLLSQVNTFFAKFDTFFANTPTDTQAEFPAFNKNIPCLDCVKS